MIKRDLLHAVKDHLAAPEISVIIGPRQVGKTTLMKQVYRHIQKQGRSGLYLNLDIESDKRHFESQNHLLRKIKLELGQTQGVIFIDEIQRKENAGLFLKGLYDMDLPYKFIVSGSGSLELKEQIHESLSGRKRLFQLNPVSLTEFVDYRTDYKYSGQIVDFFETEMQTGLMLLNEYMNFGGYPRVITGEPLNERRLIIEEIFTTYLEKDIVYLLGVSKPFLFSQVIRLVAAQTGRLMNYSKLAAQTGLSVSTLKKYLWYAEKTFIIHFVTPYFKNVHKELVKSSVPYFIDLGLRNFALGLFGQETYMGDMGFRFQNLIANVLNEKIANRGWRLQFWRTTDKAEVDFVINKIHETLPVEVKYSVLKKPLVRRSLRNFIEKYNPSRAWVINLNLSETLIIKKTKVRFVPYYELLTEEWNDN